MVDLVMAAVRGGVNLVQLRVREPDNAGDRDELLTTARGLRRATRDKALLFINGHPDVAVEAEADGVHLPEAADERDAASLPTGLLIGRSVHSVEAAKRAERAGADLLVAGTIFETASHPDAVPAGPALIGAIRASTTVPVIGIGGVGPSNAGRAMAAGATGVAVIRAIWNSPDPESAARELRRAMDDAYETRRAPGDVS